MNEVLNDALQILIQYAEFVCLMLPWVAFSVLIVAVLERITAYFRGPDWATRETQKAVSSGPDTAH